MRTTHRSKSRHEVFGPKCPDFDGNVVTKIAIVHTDERSSERRGKRTTITTDARITGTLSGGFTDDFELRGPLALDLDFVIETRVVTVIAATGKVSRPQADGDAPREDDGVDRAAVRSERSRPRSRRSAR